MTTLTWVALTVFASFPFMFSERDLSFTDAFFEAMSGLTTTGSTILTDLQSLPPGILLWRALLQWLGGIGIIVMAIAILPMLKVGGMQLFRMESTDQSTEKAMPRVAQIASTIGVIYLFLTMVWAGAFWVAGMSGFDAVAHAMTTIATGGYSTRDDSIGHFNSAAIDYIASLGMVVGALPFIAYVRMLQGQFTALPRDPQVQWFLTTVTAVVLVTTMWLWLEQEKHPADALRLATFNIISIITGTGFATDDYSLWGHFALPIFFFIMFIGGCGMLLGRLELFTVIVLFTRAFWRN